MTVIKSLQDFFLKYIRLCAALHDSFLGKENIERRYMYNEIIAKRRKGEREVEFIELFRLIAPNAASMNRGLFQALFRLSEF
jgi:hypothetical protein